MSSTRKASLIRSRASDVYYRIYLLRRDGEIDEFTSPKDMNDVKEMVRVHGTPYAIIETIVADDREVCIAREM